MVSILCIYGVSFLMCLLSVSRLSFWWLEYSRVVVSVSCLGLGSVFLSCCCFHWPSCFYWLLYISEQNHIMSKSQRPLLLHCEVLFVSLFLFSWYIQQSGVKCWTADPCSWGQCPDPDTHRPLGCLAASDASHRMASKGTLPKCSTKGVQCREHYFENTTWSPFCLLG